MKKSGSFLLRETMKPEIDYIVEKYKDPLFAISFNICQSTEDAEDVLQDTFFKYYTLSKDFEHESHLKFWLIRVVINHSRDIVTSFWRKKRTNWEEYIQSLPFTEPKEQRLLEAVMVLPEKYRTVVHLYYYEEYSIQEIAGILKKRETTIKSQLHRGRKLLKQMLKEEWYDE